MRDNLNKLNYQELTALAAEMNIPVKSTWDRFDIMGAIRLKVRNQATAELRERAESKKMVDNQPTENLY